MDTNALKRFAQEARQSLRQSIQTKLAVVLAEDSLARRESQRAVRQLETKRRADGEDRVVEQVAYTWFNRFTALHYMDMNGFNRVRVIAPSDGKSRPEILSDASGGVFDDKFISENTKNIVTALLDGRSASNDPDNEAYRLLIVSVCNAWHSTMPFLFEKIADYTELLMPDDLLSTMSILAKLREAMTAENCQDVEVIGWLYQFYISEKKDEVFAGLKKNQKVTPENIPAATQLFTPHWIVKYLVENSLGRLWMLNHPNSSLVKEMEYYIAPDEPETDFLKITSPEEIKVCDPACGSGHMLTYSFDLLYAIYEEAGYDAASIPTLILKNNLYGVELDQRAGELSAFALTMKARGKHRTFFRNPIQPKICVLENIKFDPDELNEYMERVGRDLFTHALRTTLTQFEESDNFGSLIQPALEDVDEIRQTLRSKDLSENLFLKTTHDRVLKVLDQSDYLKQKYHVVVANPPYMGGKGMNGRMANYLKEHYTDVKSDLFSAFMVRNTKLAVKKGQLGFMTPFVWMFISSYEKLRIFLLEQKTITSLIQLEYSGFEGATVPICTFTIQNDHKPQFKGSYIKLSDFRGADNQAPKTVEAIKNPDCGWFYRVTSRNFQKIPGSPVAYWVSDKVLFQFDCLSPLSEFADLRQGLSTTDNEKYVRRWFEVCISKINFNASNVESTAYDRAKWYPFAKGGTFRKWSGNNELVVNWQGDGEEIKEDIKKKYPYLKGNTDFVAKNTGYYFKEGLTWSALSSGKFSIRHLKPGFIFADKGQSLFVRDITVKNSLFFLLNSKVIHRFLAALSPTLDFNLGYISKIPVKIIESVGREKIIFNADLDWNSYETSWGFETLPLLSQEYRSDTLQYTYKSLRERWQGMTDEMLRLEEENNRIFIDAYGLQDELAPDMPIHEITLTCNPAYRYGPKTAAEAAEDRLLADTMKEFISYAVGCMFGRYALEKPGLILANAGETLDDYLRQVPEPGFPADDDNVIPVLDGSWFEDDIVSRFRRFLRVTFGDTHFEDNLRYIEAAIGRPLRDYFIKEFYKDHVQRYKKRPIYWQFSSPKGGFNALIYMNRYNRDTVSTILNRYLRDYKSKLEAERTAQQRIEISATANQREKTQALKEITSISTRLNELEAWERDVIFPLAAQRIEIDLDDGVKANYPKFGKALKPITGLS